MLNMSIIRFIVMYRFQESWIYKFCRVEMGRSGIFDNMFFVINLVFIFIKCKTFVGMIALVISLMGCRMLRISSDIFRVMHLWR